MQWVFFAAALEMLRDETKVLPRAIVISAGGLLGLLLAIKSKYTCIGRRLQRKNPPKTSPSTDLCFAEGFIKKVLYTSVGLGGAAVVCYPAASKDLALATYANVTDFAKS